MACEDFARYYNQIAHCPASLACLHLGVSPEIMSTIFFTIQFMKFYLCMAYSDLATFYGGGLLQHPFQGVCQGHGAGPAIWLTLSLCLIHMLHQFGSPTQISSATSLTSIAMVCFIGIDDCNLFALAPLLTSMLQTLQYSLDIWQGGVEATSDTLSLDDSLGVDCFATSRMASGNYTLHKLPSYPSHL